MLVSVFPRRSALAEGFSSKGGTTYELQRNIRGRHSSKGTGRCALASFAPASPVSQNERAQLTPQSEMNFGNGLQALFDDTYSNNNTPTRATQSIGDAAQMIAGRFGNIFA